MECLGGVVNVLDKYRSIKLEIDCQMHFAK